jgi:hypothetical protein
LYVRQWVGIVPVGESQDKLALAWQEHTLRERGDESAQVVRLLERALTDLDDVAEIPAHLAEKLVPDGALTVEQAVERVLIVVGRLGQSTELL